jgi:hypothetical protein
MPAARRRAPVASACARPAADRLRWVAQSSRREPAGSPVPGAAAHQRDRAALAQRREQLPLAGRRRRRQRQQQRQNAAQSRHSHAASDRAARITELRVACAGIRR